jgi:hypothetical protein
MSKPSQPLEMLKPPRRVLKAFRHTKRMVKANDPLYIRCLRSCTSYLMARFTKSVDADDRGVFIIGFSVNIDKALLPRALVNQPQLLAKSKEMIIMAAALQWQKDMDSWSPESFAWLFALMLHQASDVIPKLHSGQLNVDASYKLCPARYESFGSEIASSLGAILDLPRFSCDPSSCLHGLHANDLGSCDFDVDARGDPALVFDTSFHWRRAAEILCADTPLADCTARPAIRYLVGDLGQAVFDGSGKWHETPRAYILSRLRSVKSPLEGREWDDVAEFLWELCSAEEVGVEGANMQGCSENFFMLLAEYLQKKKKQPIPKAMRACYKKYGIHIPEMADHGIGRLCLGCDAPEKPGAKHKKCAQCNYANVRYCSKECQRLHWKSTHKHECAGRKNKGGSGPLAASADRKVPSKRIIAEQTHYLTESQGLAGHTARPPPVPGTEEFEALKLVVREFCKCPGDSLFKAAASKLPACSRDRSRLEEYEKFLLEAERAFFLQFPSAGDWAAGTGSSTSAEQEEHMKQAYAQARKDKMEKECPLLFALHKTLDRNLAAPAATKGCAIVRECVVCQATELPGKKHGRCSCRATGTLYCSSACQRRHWKSTHKNECTFARKAKGVE